MTWHIRITDEAKRDYYKLENSVRKQVLAGILKVSKAPLPSPEGYGKPLGNKNGNRLTGFFKIKYRGIGIRVIWVKSRNSQHYWEFLNLLYVFIEQQLFP